MRYCVLCANMSVRYLNYQTNVESNVECRDEYTTNFENIVIFETNKRVFYATLFATLINLKLTVFCRV